MRQQIYTYIKASVLAIVLVIGLSTLQAAWSPPPAGTVPPAGNPAVPINTSATIQTKAVGGDICIEKVAGTVKCLSSMTPLSPTGSVSSSASTCTIASSASTCNLNFTWSTANASTPNLYSVTRGTNYSTAANGTSVTYSINQGSNDIKIRDGSTVLATVSPAPTGNCITGTAWSSGSCQPVTASLSFSDGTVNCGIPDYSGTCIKPITWSISLAADPNIWIVDDGARLSGAGASGGPRNLSFIGTGGHTVQARDGNSALVSITSNHYCTYGQNPGDPAGLKYPTFWNATTVKCTPVWQAKAALPTPRGHAASATYNNKVYVFGGLAGALGDTITNVVEEYDPATDSWATKQAMPTARFFTSTNAVTVNSKIYVVAGFTLRSPAVVSRKNEEYNPSGDIWTTKLDIPNTVPSVSVDGSAAIAADATKVYYIAVNSTRAYDPVLNTWTTKATMGVPRTSAAAVTIGTKIYVVGGDDGGCVAVPGYPSCNTNEVYDTSTNIWSTKAAMPYALEAHAAATLSGYVYVMGGRAGFSNGENTYGLRYDPAANSWKSLVSGRYAAFATAAMANNKIYLMGNGGSTTVWTAGSAEMSQNTEYDPARDLNVY